MCNLDSEMPVPSQSWNAGFTTYFLESATSLSLYFLTPARHSRAEGEERGFALQMARGDVMGVGAVGPCPRGP